MDTETLCPCGSGHAYEACCGKYIEGGEVAPTAEALMRSRYTAYARGPALANVNYLVRTHDPETRSATLHQGVEEFATKAKFTSLKVIATEAGGAEDERGVVEFEARYESQGATHVMRERSGFRRVDGKWFYVDGDSKARPVARTGRKIGRNEPCPCGSGKKYKKCCGR